jgi:virginiamycin B lyase
MKPWAVAALLLALLVGAGPASAAGSPAFGSGLAEHVPARPAADPIYVAPFMRSVQFVGFSIQLPRGKGWQAMPSNRLHSVFGFDLLFFKTLEPNEYMHAYVTAHRSPVGSASASEILSEELERVVAPRGSLLKTSPDHSLRADCVRWETSRAESEPFHGVSSKTNTVSSISHYRGYLCSHPDAPTYVIEIGYFDTIPKGFPEPSVAVAEGERFLSGLSFTPLGVHVTQTSSGEKPRGLALYDDAAWLSQGGTDTVSKIDLRTRTKVAEIDVGREPEGLAVGFGSIWVPNWGSGTVSRIDPARNRVEAVIQVGQGPTQVAIGFGSAWVTNEKSYEVSRLDPATNRLSATIATNGKPVTIAIGGDSLWVEHFRTDEIWRISPRIDRVVQTVHVGKGRHFMMGDDTGLWASNSGDDTVSRINAATGELVATVAVGDTPFGLALARGKVWVGNFGDGTVSEIDPATNSVVGTPTPVGKNPFLLAGTNTTVWVLDVWNWEHGSLSRIDF